MIAKKKPKKGATAGMGNLTVKMYENVKLKILPFFFVRDAVEIQSEIN